MRIDSRIVALAVLTVAAAVGLGLAAGAWAGALTALAGLVSTVLWEITRERWERNATGSRRRESALTTFESPVADEGTPAERGVVWYLRPEAEVVAFRPRPELDELRQWCVTGGHLAVRLVTGQGGAGKTRLAVQLSQDLAEDGWRSMWVGRGLEGAAVGAVQDVGEPAVLVVDYAETRSGLSELLAEAMDADAPDMRVMLLARSAGEWWQQLVDEAEYRLAGVLEAAAPIALGPITTADGQHQLFTEAVTAFANRLEVDRPDATLTLTDPEAVVLVVHAAALLTVLDHTSKDWESGRPLTAIDVLTGLLGHESRYWHMSAVARGLILDPSVEHLAVAVGCLIGADSEAEATELLARVPDLADSAERRGQVARWLHDLYPGSDGAGSAGWVGSLRPDRVAEHLVTSELSSRSGLLPDLLAGLSKRRTYKALTLLGRAALTDTRAVGLLSHAFETDLEHLAVPALTVAVETNAVIAELINVALTTQPVSGQTLQDIAAALPYPTFALAETAADVLRRLVDQAVSAGQRARWLLELGTCLADLGRREEALAAIEEAIAIWRTLAQGPGAFLPDLAGSLTNQSNFLADLGRREEALAAGEEAVAIWRTLAQGRPGASLPHLAGSLANQSNHLAGLGRRGEALAAAEEAVAIWRPLAQTRPGAFLPDLAISLNNQSIRLADLGRREQALAAADEAARIYYQLAQASPDAFLPRLGMALDSQSRCLMDLGRRDEALAAAEEAAAIWRTLAQGRPGAFLPDLARSLTNHSRYLGGLGRRDKALAAAEEAVAIWGPLAQARPGAFLPDLAASLNNQSICLAGLGRREEALTAAEEAVAIRRPLAGAHPDAFLPELAISLNNQSNRLMNLGRFEQALAVAEEGARIYHQLAQASPDAFLPQLAAVLANQSRCLWGLGRPEQGLAVIDEAVTICRALAQANPDVFLTNLAAPLDNQSVILADLGRREQALAVAEEAVTIWRTLAQAHPDAFLPDLARSLNNLADRLSSLARSSEADAARQEAMVIRGEP